MENKNCSAGIPCQYRFMKTVGFGCKYQGYCDYQLPRDSRMQPFGDSKFPPTILCSCNGEEETAGYCTVCRKPKR